MKFVRFVRCLRVAIVGIWVGASASCVAEVDVGRPLPDELSSRSAALVGSCRDACGGPSDGCWCNPSCVRFQDCCSDYAAVCLDHSEPDAKEALRQLLRQGQVRRSYDAARDAMYGIRGNIDVRDGRIEGVYTGASARADGTRTPGGLLNTEHVWPRSQAPSNARSDIYNLYPCLQRANSERGNLPFGETTCSGRTCPFASGGSERGVDRFGAAVFQVRRARRGDIARALFYFSVRYALPIDDAQEQVLRTWHEQDLPDAYERARAAAIEQVQGNRNLFVEDPSWVDQIADF